MHYMYVYYLNIYLLCLNKYFTVFKETKDINGNIQVENKKQPQNCETRIKYL